MTAVSGRTARSRVHVIPRNEARSLRIGRRARRGYGNTRTAASYASRVLLRHPIRWRDADSLGHVNNAVYVTYIEELLIQSLGPILGDDFVTARLELNFRSELRYTDVEVVARATLERVGVSSVTFGVTIESGAGGVAADGRIVVVAWDPASRGSRALTESEKAAIGRLAREGGDRLPGQDDDPDGNDRGADETP